MPKLRWSYVLQHWRAIAAYVGGALAALFVLWFRLSSLTGHAYSAAEIQATQTAVSFTQIFHHPLNAPFTLLSQLLYELSGKHHQLFASRLAAAIYGLVAIILFYVVVRFWHGTRTAMFGTLLFGTSAWFLHTARQGSPDVLLFGVLTLVACGLWLKHRPGPWPLLASFMVGTAMLYVPGMVWVVLICTIWQLRTIDRVFKDNLWVVSIGALILLAALAPLGLSIYHAPDTAKLFAGLPLQGWPQPLGMEHRMYGVVINLFARGPQAPDHWLGQLPVIDFFGTAMFVLGGYIYARRFGLLRARLLVVMLLLGVLLIGLGGMVDLTMLLPFIYIVIAAGVGLLLDRWYRVFPRNVIAQSFGVVLLAVAVFVSVSYGARQYFVAWPHAPETKANLVVVSGTIKQ